MLHTTAIFLVSLFASGYYIGIVADASPAAPVADAASAPANVIASGVCSGGVAPQTSGDLIEGESDTPESGGMRLFPNGRPFAIAVTRRTRMPPNRSATMQSKGSISVRQPTLARQMASDSEISSVRASAGQFFWT